MKKLIIPFLMIVFGCKKNNASPEPSSNFGFNANSQNYSWTFDISGTSTHGAFVTRIPANGPAPSGYTLACWDNSQGIKVNCFMHTDTLRIDSFSDITTSSITITQSSAAFGNIDYAPLKPGDSVVVKITNITGDHISGTFTTSMHDVDTQSNQVNIMNGYFNNILITD